MKNLIVAIIGLFILAGCSKGKQYTQDLTGTWNIYKLTSHNLDVSSPYLNDSMGNYTITYTSDGHYVEQYVKTDHTGIDSITHIGTWQFQDSYGQLLMTDSTSTKDTFTILNLTGNSVELLRDGFDRYMRKQQ
jgi:hypothetical protein